MADLNEEELKAWNKLFNSKGARRGYSALFTMGIIYEDYSNWMAAEFIKVQQEKNADFMVNSFAKNVAEKLENYIKNNLNE